MSFEPQMLSEQFRVRIFYHLHLVTCNSKLSYHLVSDILCGSMVLRGFHTTLLMLTSIL